MKVGVLALQGGFASHKRALERCGAEVLELRNPQDFSGLEALVIPGGESTTISKMLQRWGLLDFITEKISQGMPVLGTCAGLILLARHIQDWEELPRLGGLDFTAVRNAYGRQTASFEADLSIPVLGRNPFRGVFIRAPQVRQPGEGVEVLASFQGSPVFLRQGCLAGVSFHPELTGDDRLHRWFLEEMVSPGVLGKKQAE